ncbi:hypothetical protein [Streptomyces sp. B3I8]|uniref:hypothetical protein n=1 Tax=Streptomyces sp. B3I8 TaxID=3042303 RepID=UPI0027842233|nr:hypothetical protein [Streptomyces sp. B3I8]MDQ0786968.1 hypothetical protein [Streptomyces sp. B3I8]
MDVSEKPSESPASGHCSTHYSHQEDPFQLVGAVFLTVSGSNFLPLSLSGGHVSN